MKRLTALNGKPPEAVDPASRQKSVEIMNYIIGNASDMAHHILVYGTSIEIYLNEKGEAEWRNLKRDKSA